MYSLVNTANYPPEILDVVETSDTNALVNDTLSVTVNVTVTLQVTAEDENENDIVTYSLNGTVPEGASITNGNKT